MIKKYNKYYRHWKDFTGLVALFALLALMLTLLNWDETFMDRAPNGYTNDSDMNMTRTMVLIITIIGLICVVIKFWLEANWQNYKNPMAFFKVLVKKQVELGLVDEEDLTENFMIKDSPFFSIFKNGKFWVEFIIMAIIPLPT